MKHLKHFIVLLSVLLYTAACRKDDKTDTASSIFAGFVKPANFPEPVYHFQDNPVTKDGFELGRRLFYEARLSRNNTISCGSCHIQSSAFTQHGHDVSHGIDDRLGTRNSPPVMNLAWGKSFFWDGGIFDLDLQPIAPIENHVEMDETVGNVISKLLQHPDYPGLFKRAFGSDGITTARLMKALSQFMLMCVSSNSRYDRIMRKENGISFTEEEQKGYQLFREKCSACHAEPLFTDGSSRNNGLAPNAVNDEGRSLVSLDAVDRYKFKVPSLRNLNYTAPYMHDGRFLTLPAVLRHYSAEVQMSATLDPLLNGAGEPGIALTEDQKSSILAFLETLNDENFIKNPLLSEQ